MRLASIVACLGLLFGVGWFAVVGGTDRTWFLGAPQIETLIDTRTESEIAQVATHPVAVETDGRWVTLRGTADSPEQRDRLLALARAVPGRELVVDELTVLERAEPYRFAARLDGSGQLTLSGSVPSVAAREEILGYARQRFGTGPVRDDLALASGAPDGDWTGMVTAGLDALGSAAEGDLEISGTTASLVGSVGGETVRDRIDELLGAAPAGTWTTDLRLLLPRQSPYRLGASKAGDGALRLTGHAPDDETRSRIEAAAAALGDLDSQITLAEGMPDDAWPGLAAQGLEALGLLDTGRLEIADDSVKLTGSVEDDAALAAYNAVADPAWTSEIAVRNPAPEPRLTLALRDGVTTVSGLIPADLSAETMARALPGTEIGDVETSAKPGSADWARALSGLSIVLPRMTEADATVTGTTVELNGMLERGFSAAGALAALRTGVGGGWTVGGDLTERPPLAEVVLAKSADGLILNGVLPQGLAPPDALDLMGDDAGGDGLTGGGEGDVADWRDTLAATAPMLALFDTATGRISAGKAEITGRLLPGYPADQVDSHFSADLPDGWSLELDATETAPSEGDRRTNLDTRDLEAFQRGYWLPIFDFRAAAFECRQRIDAVLAEDDISFVTGSAEIDEQARALLNRIAGIAARCLNSSDLSVEIAGHTDSVGNDEANMRLSRARAEAVRAALIARGVRAEAITAEGYGESQPIDTNDTAEGRARNRRISFDWQE